MKQPVQRRLAAILAADVAGHSRLMGADEEGTHEGLKAHFGQLVEPTIKEHRGRIVKNTGDGMLVEFSSVVDAVRCAVEIQRGMIGREPDVPEERRIRFRIGVNLGDVIVEEIERNVFIDSLDALHVLGKDMRASTAAHNSARFTYISPAGDLGDQHGSAIDGGYFENYGALSALELERAARLALKGQAPGVKLVILMISNDPGLARSHALVRIKEAKDGGKCLVSVAEREGTTAANTEGSAKSALSPNYLSIDKKQVQNAWLNEFLAPVQGITNVREAHGNRAAAELAVQICAEFSEPAKSGNGPATASTPPAAGSQSPQTLTAAVLDKAKNETVTNSSPVKASHDNPYFAHLAMCEEGQPAPVQPPLGWVLSQATQEAFGKLLNQCGNDHELSQLEIALGRQAPQQTAGR